MTNEGYNDQNILYSKMSSGSMSIENPVDNMITPDISDKGTKRLFSECEHPSLSEGDR
jgi:hypothetical protein